MHAELDTLCAAVLSSLPPRRGFHDELLLIDSTPVERARSVETTRRLALADATDYGGAPPIPASSGAFACTAPSPPDGTPRAFTLASPKRDEREVGIDLLERADRVGGEVVIGDKGYAWRYFAAAVGELGAMIVRPSRKDEPDGPDPPLADPPANRVDLLDLQDILTLERHGVRTSTTSGRGSPNASWRSRQGSHSTTSSGDRAGRS